MLNEWDFVEEEEEEEAEDDGKGIRNNNKALSPFGVNAKKKKKKTEKDNGTRKRHCRHLASMQR